MNETIREFLHMVESSSSWTISEFSLTWTPDRCHVARISFRHGTVLVSCGQHTPEEALSDLRNSIRNLFDLNS